MSRLQIRVLVITFVVVHFCLGCFCFYNDVFAANALMTHVYEDYHGQPKNSFRVVWEVLWFPLGPFSSLLWAVPFYGLLKGIGLLIRWRRQKGNGEMPIHSVE